MEISKKHPPFLHYLIISRTLACIPPTRPERAEAPSPGQRPGKIWTQVCRPVRAKALFIRLELESFCPYYYICTWKNKEVKIFISANFC